MAQHAAVTAAIIEAVYQGAGVIATDAAVSIVIGTVILHALYFHLREDFAVPHVALRVWGKGVPADFDEAKEAAKHMAKKITGYIKLQVPAGSANPSPPCGAPRASNQVFPLRSPRRPPSSRRSPRLPPPHRSRPRNGRHG